MLLYFFSPFVFTANTIVPIRISIPYPASPMIIAKNSVKNRKNQSEISDSLYPGRIPKMSNTGWISPETFPYLTFVGT